MGEFRVWRRWAGLALASTLVLATPGCGDDEPNDDPDGGAASESLDSDELESPDSYDCVLPSSTVGEITGFEFSGVEPDGGAIGGSHGSLTWEGCEYDTDGEATVELSVIVDETGEPDVASYDAFAATAVDPDTPDQPVIGAGSFLDLVGGLYVKTADATLHFALINADAGEPAPEDLEAIATAVLDASGDEQDCAGLPAQLPANYFADPNVTTGTSSDGTTEFTNCRFEIILGTPEPTKWDLEIGYVADPAVFDRLQAEAEGAESEEPVLVEGIGDSAFQYRSALYFKNGDTAYAVSGEDAGGEPIDAAVLEELAAAVVAAAPTVSTSPSETSRLRAVRDLRADRRRLHRRRRWFGVGRLLHERADDDRLRRHPHRGFRGRRLHAVRRLGSVVPAPRPGRHRDRSCQPAGGRGARGDADPEPRHRGRDPGPDGHEGDRPGVHEGVHQVQ